MIHRYTPIFAVLAGILAVPTALAASINLAGLNGTPGVPGNPGNPGNAGSDGGQGGDSSGTAQTAADTSNTVIVNGGVGGNGGKGGVGNAASANGGNGGNGGSGGNASATAVTNVGAGTDSAYGFSGGGGGDGGNGGKGGSAVSTTLANGNSGTQVVVSGNVSIVDDSATGGKGGDGGKVSSLGITGDIGNGGKGGDASSSATGLNNGLGSGAVDTRSTAMGGSGGSGNGGGHQGQGGNAIANAVSTTIGDWNAYTSSYAAGGNAAAVLGYGSQDGVGGNAQANATSTGYLASARSDAVGGSGSQLDVNNTIIYIGQGGDASSSAKAIGTNSSADSHAEATAIGGLFLPRVIQADATSTAAQTLSTTYAIANFHNGAQITHAITSLESKANTDVNNAILNNRGYPISKAIGGTTESKASFAQSMPTVVNAPDKQAYANGTVAPLAADVQAALVGKPNVTQAYNADKGVLLMGEMGVLNSATGGQFHDYESSLHISSSSFYGAPSLGFAEFGHRW